jgi:hypothetical protein
MPPPNQPIFTDAEIEKMRLVVTEHDKRGSVNTFDLNNPPRQPYAHQEFPRLVYHLDAEEKLIHKRVHSMAELEAALVAGWTIAPGAPVEGEETTLDAATAAEASAIDKEIADLKKKAKKRGA